MDAILQAVYAYIALHPKAVLWGLIGSWVFSNFVSAWPPPKDDQVIYGVIYRWFHGIFGNLGRVLPWLRIGPKQ